MTYRHHKESNQKGHQRNVDKLFCLYLFGCCRGRLHGLSLLVEKHPPPPSTCPQSHHPTPRGEICYLLWNKTFTVWLSLKWFTNYFGVFYPSGRYCCFPCLLIIVCDELRDVVAGLPGWSGVVFPLDLVLAFPILDSFIEDTCQQWTKVNSYMIRFYVHLNSSSVYLTPK